MTERKALTQAFEVQHRLNELQQKVQDLIKILTLEGDIQTDGEGSLAGQPPNGRGATEGELTLYELTKPEYKGRQRESLRCKNDPPVRVKDWKEVVVKIVMWHIQKGYITEDSPASWGSKYPIISRKREALSQTRGGDPKNYIVEKDGWYIDTWGNVNTRASNLIAICKDVGTDPNDFRVTLRP